jgi:Undecaprenyl-phosphate glucose phosphotransferase
MAVVSSRGGNGAAPSDDVFTPAVEVMRRNSPPPVDPEPREQNRSRSARSPAVSSAAPNSLGPADPGRHVGLGARYHAARRQGARHGFRPFAKLARFLLRKARRRIFSSTDHHAVEVAEWTRSSWVDNMTVGHIPAAGTDRKTPRTFNFDEISRTLIAVLQMVGDGLILITLSYVSLSLVIYIHHETVYIGYLPYFVLTVGTTLIMICGFARSGVYDVFDEFKRIGIFRTVKCHFMVILLLTACLFILKISDNISRLWLATWSITAAIALCGLRVLTAFAVQRLRQSGRLIKNVAIVGANEIGQQLAAKFTQERLGTRLVGIFDERQSRFVKSDNRDTKVHHLSALYELLCRGRVDEVVIAIPPYASCRVLELTRRFHPFAVSLRVLAPEGYENFQVLDSRRYGDIGTFRVMGKPLDEVAALLKRIEDVVIAVCCLLVVLPLMLVIALSIKLDSRGPVLFRQKRLGANNLPFNLLKFRSMHVEQEDPLGWRATRAGDPRITRVGRFLRMMSMDELPQLINVLRGDMSLVGPRPHAIADSLAGISFARAITEYPIRHRVKPGMTGWAQVNGWRGEMTTIEQIRGRVEHDLYYIENWSLTFDLIILGRTVFAVLSRANAI